MIKPRETFHFNPPIHIKVEWMIGLTSLEVYNSIFNITERNNKFESYRDSSNKFGFLEIKDELEEILNISRITQERLEDEMIGPRIIDKFLKLSTGKKNSVGYLILIIGYARPQFRDFESYLRIVIRLGEEDIRLILKQKISHFITFELTSGIYTIKDISDGIHTFSGHSEIIQTEYDDISIKTKIILNFKIIGNGMFGLGTLRFVERCFFHTLLGFTPCLGYKPTNSNHVAIPGVYTSGKILNLSTTNKIHLKCDVIYGSVVNGLRQPILHSYLLDKTPGHKIISEPETIHFNKIIKSVLNTITI